MVRVRKLVLAIAAASALTSGMAHALGLGEVTLKSALNQPLDAEITLLEVSDLASNEVIPKLASPEEFNKAGVDRQYFLTDLKFTPILKPNGKSVIRVTSSKPVREPYLNFLVEVLWPNGRLLREYTLLLDPPLYSPQTASAAAPQLPIAAPAPRPAAIPAPRPVAPAASAPVSRPAVPAPSSSASAGIQGSEYRTTSNDTLWQIAERARTSGSVHQTMLAIQDLNPNAFVDGNINRLKSGQVLRLPDEQQVKSRSQSEAIAQVAAQNSAWREGRLVAVGGARQLDATKRATAGEAPAQAETKDSLKLVSGDAGKAADKGAAGDSKVLTDKLAVTQESLDTTRRENDELKGRMTDLQSQLDKLQRLIQLKDEQLAKLQADLAAKGQAVPAEAAPAMPEAPVAATEQSAPTPAQPSEASPAVAPTAAAPAEPQAAAPDYNYSEEPAPQAVAAPSESAQQPAPPAAAPAAPVPETKPAPTPVVDEQPQPSLIDDLMANQMLMWAAGGTSLLVLLVLLMVLSRRNAQKESELQSSLAEQSNESAFGDVMDLPDSDFAGLESVEAVQSTEERVTAQTSDVLGEADIYIAYGRFNQAAELLQNAINDEPQRSDLRLKLMEVQAELGDRDGFARQESELREIGGASTEIDQLKAKYPSVASIAAVGAAAGAALASKNDELDFADLSFDDEPLAQASSQEEAFDLDLDDLQSGLNSEEPAAASTAESLLDFELGDDLGVASEAPADGGLDFDLGLEQTSVTSAAADDLADFSLEFEEEESSKSAADEDFLLLDDDLNSPSKADEITDLGFELPEVPAAAELPADFDLSLDDEVAAVPAEDSFAAQLEDVSAELEQFDEPESLPELAAESASAQADGLEADDDFDFLSGTDETATKLDLARAYIDMGDTEGARDILDEVLVEGSDGQQQEARELIARLA
ncbi:hypothetical protein D9M68_296670 [compost metagenome]